jgi:hypothetical protein
MTPLQKELIEAKKRINELESALSEAYNGCGIASTFLALHGRESKALDECIKLMKNFEKRGEKILYNGKEE